MVVTVQCNHCGRDFRQARHWQRFCSIKCRNDWHRHNYKLAEVRDAEAVRDAKKHLRIDTMQIVEAIKRGLAPVVAENGFRRRQLG
jgi:hypothetical protein